MKLVWCHRFSWLFLIIRLYHSSFLAGLLDNIQCCTELMNIRCCWSAHSRVSLCVNPQNLADEFASASPTVTGILCPSYLDERQLLLFGGVLLPGFVQNSTQRPFVVCARHLIPLPWGRRDDRHYASDKEVKIAVIRGSKNSQQNFSKQGIVLSFEGGTLLLKQTVTMLRIRDVIHSGPASFWCIIHVPVSVIIPVREKKALPFDSP